MVELLGTKVFDKLVEDMAVPTLEELPTRMPGKPVVIEDVSTNVVVIGTLGARGVVGEDGAARFVCTDEKGKLVCIDDGERLVWIDDKGKLDCSDEVGTMLDTRLVGSEDGLRTDVNEDDTAAVVLATSARICETRPRVPAVPVANVVRVAEVVVASKIAGSGVIKGVLDV